jgi:hypothetical protein
MADETDGMTDEELAAHYDAIYGWNVEDSERDAFFDDPDFAARAARVNAELDPDDFVDWDEQWEGRFEILELERHAA